MTKSLPAVLVAAVALAVPATSSAATVVADDATIAPAGQPGLALAGDGVAYVDAANDLRLASAGKTRKLGDLPAGYVQQGGVALSGSATRLGVVYDGEEDGGEAGAVGVREVGLLGLGGGAPEWTEKRGAIAVDADNVAWSEFSPESQDEDRIFLQEGAAAPRTVVDGVNRDDIRLAGRYLAYADGQAKQVVVRDLGAGTEAYRVPATTQQFDVQEDGTLAVADEDRACGAGARLNWASPAQPHLHQLPACASGAVRIAHGRIGALTRSRGRWYVATTDLAGTTTPVARVSERRQAPAVDFDGTTVAFTNRTCAGVRVMTAPVDGPVADLRAKPRCSMRVLGGRFTARRGVARVKVRCPHGCTGEINLSEAAKRGGSTADLGLNWDVRLPASSRPQTVAVPLEPKAAQRLRGRTIAVDAEYGVTDEDPRSKRFRLTVR